MPTFVIRHPVNVNAWLSIKNGVLCWITNAYAANTYSSKFAAKKHLRQLDNIPEGVKIELLNKRKE